MASYPGYLAALNAGRSIAVRAAVNRGLGPAFAHFMRYRKGYARAGRTIARWGVRRWRKSKLARRRKVGERIGTSAAKTREVVSTVASNTGIDTRTLYSQDLTEIPRSDNIGERERDIVNLRGFKICISLKNQDNTPVYYNLALVSFKGNVCATSQNQIETTNFFRDHSNSRGQDFSTGLTALEFHCLPINTDLYNVITHKRYRIAGRTNSSEFSNHTASYKNIDFYQKIKRQIRFANSDQESSNNKVFFVEWCDLFNTVGGQPVQTDRLLSQRKLIVYFREPGLVYK